jgi:hypothetical protein
MKSFFPALLAGALTLSTSAQVTTTNGQSQIKKTDAATPPAAAADVATSGLDFLASAGVVTAPMILTNGYLCHPGEQAGIGEGGKAVFDFTISNAGDYVIHALVNATAEDANSFYLNIDGQPEDPLMIWDIDPTTGFEDRVVSWRGDGADGSDQFAPKRFKLTAGKHQLILCGREPEAQLKSLSLRPAKPEK